MGRGENTSIVQPAAEKLQRTLDDMRATAWECIRSRYKGAELEGLVHRLFDRIYARGRVEHWGGSGENGAHLIVDTPDELGLESKIAVQVKCFQGVIADVTALLQIERAHRYHKVDAGVVVSTAAEAADEFLALRDQIEANLGIDIRVILRDELVGLVLAHLGGIPSPSATATT